MKAAVFYGPEDIRVEEAPTPQPGRGEVLIQVKACAVCGTDVRIYTYGQKNVTPPHITGHEIAGVIAEVGPDVTGVQVGERVTVVTPVSCGRCKHCLEGRVNLCRNIKPIGYYYPGGFAEYMIVPALAVEAANILPLPEGLSFVEATLAEPLSCAINGQEFLDIGFGDQVLVVGAGPIGCMHVELAKVSGATKIMLADISAERLALAQVVEAETYINSSEEDLHDRVLAETDGEGADVIITACPAPDVQQQSLGMAAIRGRISFFGGLPHDRSKIQFDSNLVHYRELSVHGAFASFHRQYKEALALFASHRIDAARLITHQLPLDDIVEGINIIRQGKALKVVVVME